MSRAREQELLDRIATLEAAAGKHTVKPGLWGLTPTEAMILGHLLTREVATRESIMATLYGARPGDPPAPAIVKVNICIIRRKLAPIGLEIESVHGVGYRMTAPMKALAGKLRARAR